ncbi:MAG: adenosylcobalamin-dependent ribonucleoside-diphosphate reductase [Spirochaetes bacterium]|nr:adenosylcobalamin-dependent ribonucleoside-diphosphate reductase [Spirochaetota bacterium]
MKNLPIKVIKRNLIHASFDVKKIKNAVKKAAFSVNNNQTESENITKKITENVLNEISLRNHENIINIEEIQDIIEKSLMKNGYDEIAKRYILYRNDRKQIREAKTILGLKDDSKFTINSIEVLKKRYLLKDDNKNIIETPDMMFKRVSSCIAAAEENYKTKNKRQEIEEKFYNIMKNLDFLPNSPTLMNAGTMIGQLSACFVLPVNDSIESIFDALKQTAVIHKTGGGTGFNFSLLRAKDDLVNTTKGEASGPLSFLEIFDKATEVIVQGGKRRGANMGILRCDHPDIIDFVQAKIKKDRFQNFNFSVGITDEFMDAYRDNRDFNLVNPRTKKKAGKINSRELFDIIVNAAWQSGDPGLIFLGTINKNNPLIKLGEINATNPCGELPLYPYESCNLGSINLVNMFNEIDNDINWEKLKTIIQYGIRFLDNVIDVNNFPLKEIESITKANRKIGLGVMGFADLLIKLKIPYNSKKAILTANKIMKFLNQNSIYYSMKLAEERGVFPNYDKSIFYKKDLKLRNATLNTIAPTGTISILAGCSSGIEPLFGLIYFRNVLSGSKLFEANKDFEESLAERGINAADIYKQIIEQGSIKKIKVIPEDIKDLFVTSFDISPLDHLKIQAEFQKFTDNSVSKTINLPPDASLEDIKHVYLSAYKMKCKGITIYRYGSKENQVLSFGFKKDQNGNYSYKDLNIESDYSGGCIGGYCTI